MKLFRGSSDSAEQKTGSSQASNRLTRRSSSMGQLVKELDTEETLCVLDLGSTSPANIRYCTERGHKIYSDDLLVSSTDPSLVTKDETGKTVLDSKKFLEENLVFPAAQFDIVLCWNLPDYLDESLVKPVVGRLWSLLKPGGSLLAFFHTQEAGPDAPLLPLPHCRYGHAGDATDRFPRATPRKAVREPQPQTIFACKGFSTTATSRISSATLVQSSSSWPAITFAKCWLCASPVS